jgi:hypothetical protein
MPIVDHRALGESRWTHPLVLRRDSWGAVRPDETGGIGFIKGEGREASRLSRLDLGVQVAKLDARVVGGELPADLALIGVGGVLPCK